MSTTQHATPNLNTERRPFEGKARRKLSVNIAAAERFGRVLLGGLAAFAGAVLLFSVGSVIGVVLEVLLIGAGIDLVVTGALGHCPLYQRLGHVPASLRRQS